MFCTCFRVPELLPNGFYLVNLVSSLFYLIRTQLHWSFYIFRFFHAMCFSSSLTEWLFLVAINIWYAYAPSLPSWIVVNLFRNCLFLFVSVKYLSPYTLISVSLCMIALKTFSCSLCSWNSYHLWVCLQMGCVSWNRLRTNYNKCFTHPRNLITSLTSLGSCYLIYLWLPFKISFWSFLAD